MADHNPRVPRPIPLPTHNHDRPQIIHKIKAVNPQARMRKLERRRPDHLRVLASLDHEAREARLDEGLQEGRVEGRGHERREGRRGADGHEAMPGPWRGRGRGEAVLGLGEGFGEGVGEVLAGRGGAHRCGVGSGCNL